MCIAIDGGRGREGEPPSQLTPLVGYVVGDFRDEIKILHFLQMGEIRAILFLLPHAPSTLANCYRMCSIR